MFSITFRLFISFIVFDFRLCFYFQSDFRRLSEHLGFALMSGLQENRCITSLDLSQV